MYAEMRLRTCFIDTAPSCRFSRRAREAPSHSLPN
jgi:hypothetical protein